MGEHSEQGVTVVDASALAVDDYLKIASAVSVECVLDQAGGGGKEDAGFVFYSGDHFVVVGDVEGVTLDLEELDSVRCGVVGKYGGGYVEIAGGFGEQRYAEILVPRVGVEAGEGDGAECGQEIGEGLGCGAE